MSTEGDRFPAPKSMESVDAFLDAIYQQANECLRLISRDRMSDRLLLAIACGGDEDSA